MESSARLPKLGQAIAKFWHMINLELVEDLLPHPQTARVGKMLESLEPPLHAIARLLVAAERNVGRNIEAMGER